VHDGGEEKSDESGVGFSKTRGTMKGEVDMTEKEVVNGFVPLACKLIPGGAIPPVIVKTPIGKSSEFSKFIKNALKCQIK